MNTNPILSGVTCELSGLAHGVALPLPACPAGGKATAEKTAERRLAGFAKTALVAWCLLTPCLLAGPFASVARAGTNCVNGTCYSCDGTLSCLDGVCTCNGAPIQGGNIPDANGAPVQGGDNSSASTACGVGAAAPHPNGGGVVAVTATVEKTVYVSKSSAVCGNATVAGQVRLLSSIVRENSTVAGESVLESTMVSGNATVESSSIKNSLLSGNVTVTGSTIANSTLNGSATAVNAKVSNSILDGNANVVDRTVNAAILRE
ncbi:MAG: hypothetical protein ACLPPF_15965 [Rhodomicrobium sp.]